MVGSIKVYSNSNELESLYSKTFLDKREFLKAAKLCLEYQRTTIEEDRWSLIRPGDMEDNGHFYFPTLFILVLKTDNLFFKSILFIPAVVLDLFTLPIRCIVYLCSTEESHAFARMLIAQGVDREKVISKDLKISIKTPNKTLVRLLIDPAGLERPTVNGKKFKDAVVCNINVVECDWAWNEARYRAEDVERYFKTIL